MNYKKLIAAAFCFLILFGLLFAFFRSSEISPFKEGFADIDVNTTIPLPKNGLIPENYYQVTIKDQTTGDVEVRLAQIPYGFKATSDKSKIYPVTQEALYDALQNVTGPLVPQDGDLDVMKLNEGDDVWGNYKMKGLWYSGRVSKVNTTVSSEKTYDIVYGTPINETETNIVPVDQPNNGRTIILVNNDTKKFTYDVNNINVQYHEPADQIAHKLDTNPGVEGTAIMFDSEGRKHVIPRPLLKGDITYYEPGTFPYGANNYVPNYEDSIYLSKTTHMSTVTPVGTSVSDPKGICEKFKNNPMLLEQACNSVDVSNCGSMNCCVLLGGAKCVSGTNAGPTYTSNYSDLFVRNKDLYYYQGKCYGNCEGKQIYDSNLVGTVKPKLDHADFSDKDKSWKPTDAYESILNPNKAVVDKYGNNRTTSKTIDKSGIQRGIN
jgi:hypothetical protein